MLSYNNDPSTKADHVSLSILHAEGDRLSSGSYGNTSTGIGCSVGCHAMDYGLRNDDHAGLAKHIGWPEWLVRLQDTIFEGLPATDRGAWHVALAEAVPVGVDLTKAYHRICARMLREVSWPKDRPDDQWGCAVAVRRVAELHEASTAAWSAESAARSAEWAAESAGAAAGAAGGVGGLGGGGVGGVGGEVGGVVGGVGGEGGGVGGGVGEVGGGVGGEV